MTLPQPCWSRPARRRGHVGVPPDGVAGLDVRDAGERAQEQRVPLLVDREDLADGDAAHVVLGDVGQQRAQQHVDHRLGDRDGEEHALVVRHVRQRGPALEGAECRAHRGARVLRTAVRCAASHGSYARRCRRTGAGTPAGRRASSTGRASRRRCAGPGRPSSLPVDGGGCGRGRASPGPGRTTARRRTRTSTGG